MYEPFIDKFLRVRKDKDREYLEKCFDFLSAWGCIEKYRINGDLAGVALYWKTDGEDFEKIPENPTQGRNLFVLKIIVKDGYEKQNIPLRMLKQFMKNNPDIEKICLEYHKDEHLKSFNLKRREYELEKTLGSKLF